MPLVSIVSIVTIYLTTRGDEGKDYINPNVQLFRKKQIPLNEKLTHRKLSRIRLLSLSAPPESRKIRSLPELDIDCFSDADVHETCQCAPLVTWDSERCLFAVAASCDNVYCCSLHTISSGLLSP